MSSAARAEADVEEHAAHEVSAARGFARDVAEAARAAEQGALRRVELGAREVVERYEIDEGPSEEDLAGAREWVERAAVELSAAVR